MANIMHRVYIDAVHPEELIRAGQLGHYLESSVFIRVDMASGPGGGWPLLELMGSPEHLKEYIEDHWDESTYEALREDITPMLVVLEGESLSTLPGWTG